MSDGARTAQADPVDEVVATPAYMAAFRCVGGDCPETCCSGWSVSIDRATYERYMAVDAERLRSLLRAHVRRNDDAGDRQYGVIAADLTGRCGLLDAHGLCTVQAELGAQYLSDVCHQFPREYVVAGTRLTMFGSFACPEAARLALHDADAMQWRTVPVDGWRRPVVSGRRRRRSPGLGGEQDLAGPDVDVVRASAETIAAAARSLIARPALSARMAWEYLAWVLRGAVQAAREAADPAHAVQALRDALDEACAPGVAEAVARARRAANDDLDFQMLRFVDQTVGGIRSRRSALRSAAVPLRAWQALGFDAADAAGSVRRYRDARAAWFDPFERARPHVIRHWLLNDLGLLGFPAVGADALHRHVTGFHLRLMLVETLLVARAAERREAFSIDDCVAVMHAVARHVEHERSYRGTALMGEASAPAPAAAAQEAA